MGGILGFIVRWRLERWLKIGAFDQLDQFILRKRTYLEGEFCMYNKKQKALYRAYLDKLEKRIEVSRHEKWAAWDWSEKDLP